MPSRHSAGRTRTWSVIVNESITTSQDTNRPTRLYHLRKPEKVHGPRKTNTPSGSRVSFLSPSSLSFRDSELTICIVLRRQVQARAVGSHELLLPELLEHVRQYEQEGCRQGELWQWRLSDLAHQAILGLGGSRYSLFCEWIYDWKGSETGLDGEIEDAYFSNAVNDRFKYIGPNLVFPSRGYLYLVLDISMWNAAGQNRCTSIKEEPKIAKSIHLRSCKVKVIKKVSTRFRVTLQNNTSLPVSQDTG